MKKCKLISKLLCKGYKENNSPIKFFFYGEILEIEVSKAISTKELDDLDLDIIVSYENNQLDVDVDVGVTFDKLSEITQDQVAGAIDEAYLKFDSYIDENYRQ